MAVAVWPAVREERDALAEDLAGLTEDQWAVPSLCAGWSVRDVVAHMTGSAKMTVAGFFPKLIASGFSLAKMQDKDIAVEGAGSPADVLRRFRDIAASTTSPPGPKVTWLGEALIHAEDVRRPLGLTRDYPTESVRAVADFYRGSNLVIGAKKRVAGLSLRATDAEWATGTGPEVTGPLLALLMAMVGRPAYLDDCTGEGVAVLKAR